MLCDECENHFSHGPETCLFYLRLKTRLVSLAKKDFTGSPWVAELEADLRRYEAAIRAVDEDSDLAPCPWFLGSIPDAEWELPASYRHQCHLEIWAKPKTGSAVQASARNGCFLCQRLCALVEQMPQFGHIKTTRFESWLHLHPVTLKPSAIRFLVHKAFQHEWLSLLLEEDNSADTRLIEPRGTANNHDSPLNFLKTVLDSCLGQHEACRVPASQQWIPTRLLDCEPHSATSASANSTNLAANRDYIRLVHRREISTDDPSRRPAYATLSHVWGEEQIFTLTQDNIQRLRECISVAELPQCFQDAVGVVRRYGIRYLWIDSLCIMQDGGSRDDWVQEAANMHKIYSSGMFNIAACLSTSSNESIFRDREPSLGGPFSITWDWQDHKARFQAIFNWHTVVIRHSPLYRRGWVVQERLISPRSMHLSTYPFWECKQMVTCEAYPTDHYANSIAWIPEPNKVLTRSDAILEDRWAQIISYYSYCELTEFSDKLIALSGIARIFAQHMSCKYYAGLWESNLLQGLLWQVRKHASGGEMVDEKPTQYVAPSWSWAAVDGPIVARNFEIAEKHAEVVDVLCSSPSIDPFGTCTEGTLVLRAKSFSMPTLWAVAQGEGYGSDRAFDKLAISFDEGTDSVRQRQGEHLFLPIITRDNAVTSNNLNICGLIVGRSRQTPECYERIGFAVVDGANGEIANTGWFVEDWNSPPWRDEERSNLELV